MLTRQLLRFARSNQVLTKQIKRNNHQSSEHDPKNEKLGGMDVLLACQFGGVAVGGAAGIVSSGVALGEGEVKEAATKLFLGPIYGGLIGSLVGVPLGMVVAAPRAALGVAAAVGVVAAVSRMGNK